MPTPISGLVKKDTRKECRMPFSTQEHLENLLRHIKLVQEAAYIMGTRLIKGDRFEFGKALIQRGFVHDSSKFQGIEWEYLHVGPDVPEDKLRQAITQHVTTNDHHPEFWGGISKMPEICVAEMCCDWMARAQEFGTSIHDWVEGKAIDKFKIKRDGKQHKSILKFIKLLTPDPFKK